MRKRILLQLIVCIATAAFAQSNQWVRQEQELVKQLNASRREAGLPALRVNPELTEAARKHSAIMAEQDKLSHVLPGEDSVAKRLADTGLRFNRSGENVGYNTDFNGVHEGFMNSPPHRANILSPDYTEVGIGVVHDDKGVWWATQDFAHTLAERSASQAEDLAAQSFTRLRRNAGTPPLKRLNSTRLMISPARWDTPESLTHGWFWRFPACTTPSPTTTAVRRSFPLLRTILPTKKV
jgi:hypothetical protein